MLWQGPIPARAGEPNKEVLRGGKSGAYPRSRGGTDATLGSVNALGGLSPLARGNRRW